MSDYMAEVYGDNFCPVAEHEKEVERFSSGPLSHAKFDFAPWPSCECGRDAVIKVKGGKFYCGNGCYGGLT